MVPDSAPVVEILSPGGDTTVTAGDSVTVSFMATDDHGIQSVVLRSWVVLARGARQELADRSYAAHDEGAWSGAAAVSAAPLQPGDALHVVATAIDGSPWRQAGESREVVLRLPR